MNSLPIEAVEVPLPPALPAILARAHARLRARLTELAPRIASELLSWMDERARGRAPEQYFTHPSAFPLVLLPWWLDEALGGSADPTLQGDLAYSSMSGYYAIRLIDDVMDGSPDAAPTLLPAISVVNAEFQATYAHRFAADHPFWRGFHAAWARGAEAAIAETRLASIDEASFLEVSAGKVWPGVIPMSAVAWHRTGGELPGPWMQLFSAMCAFHQRQNDLFDWHRDQKANARTWILCEANRHKQGDESVTSWMVREGFELGFARVMRDLDHLDRLAAGLESPGLFAYLAARRVMLDEAASAARPALRALDAILETGRRRDTRELDGRAT